MCLWLIGAGPMAQDYAKVLAALESSFVVIGRSEPSAFAFEEITGQAVYRGGLEGALENKEAPEVAIVAVGVEQLARITEALIKAGTQRILIEKPGGLNLAEIRSLERCAGAHGAVVMVAYNRRFYASVEKLREYIDEDGGVLSAQFDFTERSHLIAQLEKLPIIKERWVLGNSSHVIDLVFHLIGMPVDWRCWHSGMLDWHPASARFAGAGKTDMGVMFSYLADWQAPGRWGIDVMTSKRRLTLRPMEQLQVTTIGGAAEAVQASNRLDIDYKPGLYRQTAAFLQGEDSLLCKISEQARNVQLYSQMAGYI